MVAGLVVFVSGLNCPEKQYPYTCPSCLSITAEETSEFDSAEESCRNSDGGLVTIEDSSQFQRLGRYLEGFNLSSNRLWVGYRYSGSGNRIDTDGKTASPVLLNQNSFAPGDTHRTDDCIGIQMGLFFSAPCSESLGHVCVHLYEGTGTMLILIIVEGPSPKISLNSCTNLSPSLVPRPTTKIVFED